MEVEADERWLELNMTGASRAAMARRKRALRSERQKNDKENRKRIWGRTAREKRKQAKEKMRE